MYNQASGTTRKIRRIKKINDAAVVEQKVCYQETR